jgi:hypothetical protein
MAARKASSSSRPALGDQFDAAVGQITHNTGNFKSGGGGSRGVAEPDALHVTGINNPHAAAVCDWHLLRHAGMKPEPDTGCNVKLAAAHGTFFNF